MTETYRTRSAYLRGLGRLVVEAIVGLTDLVEAMHRTISVVPGPLGKPPTGRTTGITGFVYGNVRGVTRLVGRGVDAALAVLAPLLGEATPSPRRDALIAALNGVLGDHLEESGNPLAIPMRLRRNGQVLAPDARTLADAIPEPSRRLVLLVHGLCRNDAGWHRKGHHHGTALERDLGVTSVTLSYNTGRHVSANGRELAQLLEAFRASWPVPLKDVAIVAHSMGGLVARSALHHASEAGHAWPKSLRLVVFLGTPFHGTPLEQGGSLVDAALGVSPYSFPFRRLGRIRSAGITDLRHGNLLDEDWAGHDRFERIGDVRRPLPLPAGVACYAVAATTAKKSGRLGDRLVGDGLVPVASALGRHADPARTLPFPPSRTWIARGMSHLDLLGRPEVYARLREWLGNQPLDATQIAN
ncbi:MAG: esterase/lipase family protein [Thermoanaerobaculia bacterium]